ncbi:MAG: VCBS repeat-containing protein [Planctomycetota bacterium]|nr:MAG: VCBS repeat-containing protein [Planctomycetota bacterium]
MTSLPRARRLAPPALLLGSFSLVCSTCGFAQLAAFPLSGSLPPQLPFAAGPLDAWAVGDLDADGLTDLVAGVGQNPFVGAIVPHFQRLARPAFASGPLHFPGVTPAALALGDISGDGRLDLVAANSPFAGLSGITVSTGLAGGAFSPPISLAHLGNARRLAIADFDADGRADLALLEYGPPQLELLRGLPAGGLGAGVVTALPAEYDELASGDFDGDGDLELLVGATGGALVVASAGASGGFSLGTTLVSPSGARRLVIGDLDADGADDVVAWSSANSFTSFLGGGAGLTPPSITKTTTGVVQSVVLAHLVGDEALDAAVSTGVESTLSTYRGFGNGGFASPLSSGVRAAPRVALDFDGDGRDELIVPGAVQTVVELAATGIAPGHQAFSIGPVTSVQHPLAHVDLSGDGKRDLVWATASSEVGVALGFQTTGFQFGTLYSMPGALVSSVQLSDLDDDDDLDLVALAASSSSPDKGTVFVRKGNGDGTFGLLVGHPTTAAAFQSLRTGDVDGDGALDVVTLHAQPTQARAWILRGDGAGDLLPAQPFDLIASAVPSSGFPALALGDFDLDGRSDLATCTLQSGGVRVSIYAGTATGTFAHPAQVVPHALPFEPTHIALADLDADGRPDLLLRQSGGQSTAPALVVLRASGPFAFDAPQSYGAGYTSDLACADFSGDGKLDVALYSSSFGVQLFRGHGNGGLYAPEAVLTGGGYGTAGIATDFDADGRIDLLNLGSSSIDVWLNGTQAKVGLVAYGPGLPGCGGAHALTGSSTPHAGNASFALEWQNAPASSGGLALIGFGPLAPVPTGADLLGIGIPLHVDVLHPNGFFVVGTAGTPSGAGALALPIPDDASLIGVSLYAQLAWPWTAGPCTPSLPFGLSASNGLAAIVQP